MLEGEIMKYACPICESIEVTDRIERLPATGAPRTTATFLLAWLIEQSKSNSITAVTNPVRVFFELVFVSNLCDLHQCDVELFRTRLHDDDIHTPTADPQRLTKAMVACMLKTTS